MSEVLFTAEQMRAVVASVPGANASDHTQPEDGARSASLADQLVRHRVIVRTQVSGVSIGILNAYNVVGAPGSAGAATEVHLVDAWRIYSWSGGAFTLSEIAREGNGVLRVDRHPDGGVIMTDTLGVEILPVGEAAFAKLQAAWAVGSRK